MTLICVLRPCGARGQRRESCRCAGVTSPPPSVSVPIHLGVGLHQLSALHPPGCKGEADGQGDFFPVHVPVEEVTRQVEWSCNNFSTESEREDETQGALIVGACRHMRESMSVLSGQPVPSLRQPTRRHHRASEQVCAQEENDLSLPDLSVFVCLAICQSVYLSV